MNDVVTTVARGPRRLLVCSAGIPHESVGASVVLFFHYIDRLRRAGFRVLHLMMLEGPTWPDTQVEAYRAKMADGAEFEVVVARSSAFVAQRRCVHWLDEAALAPALEHARAFQPDAIVAFDIIPAWAVMGIEALHRVVWLGDLHFQTVWLHALYSMRENVRAALHLPSNWLVCRAWRRVYASVLRKADGVIVSSAASRRLLGRLGIDSIYEPYPWPDERRVGVQRRTPARPTFLFFGNLVGLGSRSALHFMVERVYPQLIDMWGPGGFSIFIAGRGELPQGFGAAISGKPEFERLGYVPDLDSLMARCHAVLVPIDVPVGNRSRILTAMTKGALVIAHENVSLGNPDLVDGATCYLARDAAGFADRMRRAVNDESEVRRIIAEARRIYEANFHPDRAAPRLVDKLTALAAA